MAGATTNLIVDVDGTAVTISTDITVSSLTTAPSSNNTALVNDTTAADQEATRTWGEHGAGLEYITIDTIGTEITSLNGKWASFKINDGTNDEYFFAFVNTTNSRLEKIYRGFFYNSSLAPVNRIKFANNDTITLMNTAWVFAENDGTTIDVSYNNPVWSDTAPSSPVTGDYWYDLGNLTWKRYDGASFQLISRVFIGIAVIDSTNCVAARCVDFYKKPEAENTMSIEISTTEIVRSNTPNQKCFVNGTLIDFGYGTPSWNITTDLATSADLYVATEQASTVYYLYISDAANMVISDISPHYRPDLRGWYHPHNTWRCIGTMYNDSGSDISLCDDISFNDNVEKKTVTYLHQVDGAVGGTITAGSYQVRTLNVAQDNFSFAGLSSNQVTALPGIYQAYFGSCCYKVSGFKARIYDTASSTELIQGNTAHSANAGDYSQSEAAGGGRFIVPPGTVMVIELQHVIETSGSTADGGRNISAGSTINNFARLSLTKVG